MCGIAGIVDFSAGIERQYLASMVASLGRRGPDASGVFVDGPCGLAHTRLSVIDPHGSPQPMTAPDLAVTIIYNGELYNYRELRSELLADGIAFDSAGDTEVILRLLSSFEVELVSRLDGMFAFALWHGRRRQLLLVRDRLGVKPLFYSQPRPGLLVFGSEVKAVLAHPAVDRGLNEDALRQVLRSRASYGSNTLCRGVQQLGPGCALFFDASGSRISRYWNLDAAIARSRSENREDSDAERLERCGALFEEAVRKRLVADVPLGAFLSGGLDSSLVVATMCRLRGAEPTRTFSVGFRDDPFSELPHARLVAERLGTVHSEVLVDERDYMKRLADLSGCRDAPVSEPADVAIACMSAAAKEHVKVVLTGEGADEAFAGYPKYAFARAPAMTGRLVHAVGPERIAGLAAWLGLDRRRALVAARALAHAREIERLVQWFSYMDRELLSSLLPGLGWTEAHWKETIRSQEEALLGTSLEDPVARMQYLDAQTYLPCNLLERGDRMTMAHGLEARFPFLDRELFPFGIGLDTRHKLRGRKSKVLLRRLARGVLPPPILARRKWGFRVPLQRWFQGALQPFLCEHLDARAGLCGTYGDRARIQRLLDDSLSGAIDASLTLWTLLTAEVWYQHVHRARDHARQGFVA
jgi:asparagine synthase (glutamine-hydrolysing)